MTIITNGNEAGTDGADITAGTSGGDGTAFNQATRTTSASVMKYRASNASGGSMSLELSPASTETAYVGWSTALAASGEYAMRSYIRMAALPTTTDIIHQARSASSNGASLRLTNAGFIGFLSRTGSASITQTGTAVTPSLATAHRFESRFKKGTTVGPPGDGEVYGAWYIGDSGTIQGSVTSAAFDTGTADFNQVRFGRAQAVTGTWPAYWDLFAADDAPAGALIGPPPSAPPTVVERFEPAVAVVDLRASTSGVPLSFSIAQTSGPTQTAAEIVEGYFEIPIDSTTATEWTATIVGATTVTRTYIVPPLSGQGADGHAQVLRRVAGVWV